MLWAMSVRDILVDETVIVERCSRRVLFVRADGLTLLMIRRCCSRVPLPLCSTT